MQKKSNIIFLVIYLAIIAVVIFGLFFLFSSNLFNNSGNLKLEHGTTEIHNNSKLTFETDKNLYIYCKYNFAIPDTEEKYSVKIMPSVSNKFNFNLGDEVSSSQGIKELTEYFKITMTDDYFILYFENDMSMQSLLSEVYSDYEVSFEKAVDIFSNYYFDVHVSSYDLQESIMFSFKLSKGGTA